MLNYSHLKFELENFENYKVNRFLSKVLGLFVKLF